MIGIDKTSLTRSLTGCIITAYFDDYLLSVIKSVRSRPTDGKSKTRKQTYLPILYYIPFRECGFINQLDCRVCEKKVLVHVYLVLLRMRRFFVMAETRILILNTKLVFVIVLQTAHFLKHFVMVQCTVWIPSDKYHKNWVWSVLICPFGFIFLMVFFTVLF